MHELEKENKLLKF